MTKYRVPPHRILQTAAELALTAKLPLETIQTIELCIRIVGNEESTALNARYRHKNKPTNVLAFAADDPAYIGDIILCAQVIKQEACNYDRTLSAHFSHMVIHGTLHLLGFDHQTEKQARVMESLETQLLQQLGFKDPYQID